MKYSALASYPDGSFRHILDATGDVDQGELMDKAFEIAKFNYGHPSAVTLINTSMPSGYEATMAKVTHDMWGKPTERTNP